MKIEVFEKMTFPGTTMSLEEANRYYDEHIKVIATFHSISEADAYFATHPELHADQVAINGCIVLGWDEYDDAIYRARLEDKVPNHEEGMVTARCLKCSIPIRFDAPMPEDATRDELLCDKCYYEENPDEKRVE